MGSIEKTVNDDAIVISLKGQLEVASTNDLDNNLDPDKLERDVVIFDFTKADYISSSIIGWLAGFRSKMVADNKREPIITGCNKTIMNLFQITGVNSLFKWAE